MDYTGNYTFAECWNGRSWTVGFPQNPNCEADYALTTLSAVSCTAPGRRVAVGSAQTGRPWWASPRPGPASQLTGVSCPSPTSCVASVEQFPNPSDHVGFVTLAESWNGATWGVEPTINPSLQSLLAGVSCPSVTKALPSATTRRWRRATNS